MKKVIARIKGGVGNQLFCYAAARRLALFNQAELILDNVSGFVRDHRYKRQYALDRFMIHGRKASPYERMEPFERPRRGMAKLLAKRLPFHARRYIEQESRDFDPRFLDLKIGGTVYIDGLWQSEAYFKDVESAIREDLVIIPPDDDHNRRIGNDISACNAVAMHVRWFDLPGGDNILRNVSKNYYLRAIDRIRSSVKDPHFYLFSDDLSAAKDLVALPEQCVTPVGHNRGDENAYADLWLMSQCKHFIIANSTFSWWGAWLARYPKKNVFVPDSLKCCRPVRDEYRQQFPVGWILL